MTVRNLQYLFDPKSVAVVGASNRPHSVGSVVMKNLLGAGFKGAVLPVNPHYKAVNGVLAYPAVDDLPLEPDLGVICTPAAIVPEVLDSMIHKNVRAAVILTAGVADEAGGHGKAFAEAVGRARQAGLRILGPNCLGVAAPRAGLNATFAHLPPRTGSLAFITQSGALGTAILDWAARRQVGFSYFVSLGNTADIDIDDLLDYVSGDARVSGILLYIEAVRQARNFMSAARAAARNKAVIAIKAGRYSEGARAAATHTGALAGADDVYDAAFRRAGMLRVYEIDELFDAAETLALARPISNKRMLILTNGGGPGVMATDALVQGGGIPAELTPEQIAELDAVLPPTWSQSNPVDIIGDATPERYRAALERVLQWNTYDAVLVMNVPTAVADSVAAASVVAELAAKSRRPVITNWLGGETADRARRILSDARIPTYTTPEKAVRAFLHIIRYRENQRALMETPPSLAPGPEPRLNEAQRTIAHALDRGRTDLSEPEVKSILDAFGIPVVPSAFAASPAEAADAAESIGFPVALKILSPEVSHKSDVGGVVLRLDSRDAVQNAARTMLDRVKNALPDASIDGFVVQPMVERPEAHELLIGVKTDPVFGPAIAFGHGGTAVEVVRDVSIGLPPLNRTLAENLVNRTRISKLLRGYRDRRPADLDAVYDALDRISRLVVTCPEVIELDINPLYADSQGVVALDARMRIAPFTDPPLSRLAIRPYPAELEESVSLKNGVRLLLRPIRPEDEPAHQEFFTHLRPEDIYYRFFGLVREFAHAEMARFTQIDYDREMAFIAVMEERGAKHTVGVVRAMSDPDKQTAEFAIIVRSDMKGQGLGTMLMNKMIRYCRDLGLQTLTGQIRYDNKSMLGLATALGFTRHPTEDPGILEVRLPLQA